MSKPQITLVMKAILGDLILKLMSATDILMKMNLKNPALTRNSLQIQTLTIQTIQMIPAITRIMGIRIYHRNPHSPRKTAAGTIQQIPRHSPRSSPQNRRRMIPRIIPQTLHRTRHSRRKSLLTVATVLMMIIPLQ